MGPASADADPGTGLAAAACPVAATLTVDLRGRDQGPASHAADVPLVLVASSPVGWSASSSPVARSHSRCGLGFPRPGHRAGLERLHGRVRRSGRPGSGDRPLPGTELFAVLSDSSFVWWFVFLALVLQLTPPGRAGGSPRWLAAALSRSPPDAAFQVAALLRSRHLDPPLEDFVSPLRGGRVAGPSRRSPPSRVYLLGLCLVAAVVSCWCAWRRPSGDARRQLLWLAVAAPRRWRRQSSRRSSLSSGDQYALRIGGRWAWPSSPWSSARGSRC